MSLKEAVARVNPEPCGIDSAPLRENIMAVWRALLEASSNEPYVGTATARWVQGPPDTVAVNHAVLGNVVVVIQDQPFGDPNVQVGDVVKFVETATGYETSEVAAYNDRPLLTMDHWGGTVANIKPGWALANGTANSVVNGGNGKDYVTDPDYSVIINIDEVQSYDVVGSGVTVAAVGDQIEAAVTGDDTDDHEHDGAAITGSVSSQTVDISGTTDSASAGIEVDDHDNHTHANTVADHASHTHANTVADHANHTHVINESDRAEPATGSGIPTYATPTDIESPTLTHTVTPVSESATLTHTVTPVNESPTLEHAVREGVIAEGVLDGAPTFTNPNSTVDATTDIFANAEAGDTIIIEGVEYTIDSVTDDNTVEVVGDASGHSSGTAVQVSTGGHEHSISITGTGSHTHGDTLGVSVGQPDGITTPRVHNHTGSRSSGTAAVMIQRVF